VQYLHIHITYQNTLKKKKNNKKFNNNKNK
jgi:hypothetical protein